MKYQDIFERYELKYLVSQKQKEEILEVMSQYMNLDEYGKHTIRNIYFDTPSYRLIRDSLGKPIYKEKLRLRSYAPTRENSPVFIELKKKYQSIVYKRRICVLEKEAMDYLCQGKPLSNPNQVSKEIDYFKDFYENLIPRMFLSYEREAYACLDDTDFRVTFDQNILWRRSELDLKEGVYGNSLLPQRYSLMEVKTPGSIPLWMVAILTKEKVYKTSFSKYGEAFRRVIEEKRRVGYV